MRYFQPPADTRFYAGVDLHARSLALCVLDAVGQVVARFAIVASPQAGRDAIAPYRDNLAIACACRLAWYGLADFCTAAIGV